MNLEPLNNQNNPNLISDFKTNTNKTNNTKYIVWDFVWSITLIVLSVLILLRIFVFQQVNVHGSSMQPNYYSGEQLLINDIDKNFQRGQVVAVYENKEVAGNSGYFTRFAAVFYLKRIIALPGEEVEIVGDTVILYNKEHPEGAILDEGYISKDVKAIERKRNAYFPRTKIGEKEYFLLGDNRGDSLDSRIKGAFPDYAIFGKETAKYLPINKFRLFNLPTYSYPKITDEISSLKKQLESK